MRWFKILINYVINDDVMVSNPSFNRIIEDQNHMELELTRSDLTNITYSSVYSGLGVNSAVTIFSPGVNFKNIGISVNNILHILTGSNAGFYTVTNPSKNQVDIVESSSITFPLQTSGFVFRLSNIVYSDIIDVTEIDDTRFYDDNIEFIFYGAVVGWKIVITSGLHTGTYIISSVNPDNSVSISGLSGLDITENGLSYELRTNTNTLRHTGTSVGKLRSNRIGRIEIDPLVTNISPNYYAHFDLFPATRFIILSVDVDNSVVYIGNWKNGDIAGTSMQIRQTMVDGSVGGSIFGYFSVRGMELTGTTPTIDNSVENNQFLENYAILINDNYYKITEIDGSVMKISGVPVLTWSINSPTSVSYAITHFEKIPVVTQDGNTFSQIDRRGGDSFQIYSHSASMGMSGFSEGVFVDSLGGNESIWIDITYKD